ncbi:helix-turn-helix domain-containing protein [Kibdelosporangium persicum]|uniref:HTH cro/C1-type domain-containing protein n=1 Tax=Kibdelosporangium persicum TaxID=2698649 RepID=A0ABX2FBH5_9PSEU|nr:helix-turn-helix domain-containing protein [Kibdelosporangium persicum]NRN68734.1 hypothetical protein [Kibdelosporangium persicum]
MARRETSLGALDDPVQQFAHDLRELRRQVGNPSYRELAKRAHYSASMLSTAANGRKLPSEAVTLAFVRACGGDTEEWKRRWREVGARVGAATAVNGGESATRETAVEPEHKPAQSRRWLWYLCALVVLAVAGGLVAFLLVHQQPPPQKRTFSAIAAEDCRQDETRRIGMNPGGPDGASGWSLEPLGGFAGDGCGGGYRYTPGSGTDKPGTGPDNFSWVFRPDLPGESTCAVRIYIPNGNPMRVGGSPAHYSVESGPDGAVIDTFTIDQQAHKGSWVDAGEVRFSGVLLIIRMSDRNAAKLPVAASAAAVDCRVTDG